MTVSVPRSDVDRFRSVIAARLGLFFEDRKVEELGSVLAARVSGGGFDAAEELARVVPVGGLAVAAVRGGADGLGRARLIERVVDRNHTWIRGASVDVRSDAIELGDEVAISG